ncbi:hypothetical protein ACHAXT_002178 [Thalassiosira profunda]
MIAARRLLQQWHHAPRASIGRSSVTAPSLAGRRLCVARRDAHITCLAGVHRQPFNQSASAEASENCNHRRRWNDGRWLSASAGDPPVEVTVTSAASDAPSPSDRGESTEDGPGPTLSKSPDQLAEEEILALQGELRAHHRHAAYDAALATAVKLLDLTSDHFGTLHPATASAHNNVGLMHKMLGNYVQAREAYHESLRIYGEVVGKDHASYAAALSNLGMLERGRVLESEAEGDEEQNESAVGNNEEGVELGELRDGNAPESSKMSALERMQLNESAIEYFDEAYRIRLSELGANHPHTITSRSQLGAAMAAAVIAERKGRIGGLVESELRKMKHQKDVKDAKEMEAYIPEALARAAAKSSSGSKLTRRRWEAAEEHLRGALDTAVENPRGESVGPLISIPVGSNEGRAAPEQKGTRRGLTLPQKDEKRMSRKEKRKMEKSKRRAARDAQKGLGDGAAGSVVIQGAAGKVTTLSAATAAQNLAVFLKNYADWLRLTLMDDGASKQTQSQQQMEELNQAVQEARHLYEAALHVRQSILPNHHPLLVVTKFSLAELLDSPKAASLSTLTAEEDPETIDGERANALREEILSAYNVEERQEDPVGSRAG